MRLAAAADVFVGRESELAALTKWSAALGAPRAGVAVVVGEAGVGKSTLLGRAVGDWEQSRGLLLVGGGVAIQGLEGLQSPFGVFTEALRGVASRSDVDARTRELVSRWLDSSRRTGELDPTQRRREELLELVQELSSTRPLLLVLEDLHWVDPSSLGALVFLARQLGSERVGVVVSSRRPVGAGMQPPFASVLDHLQRLPDALVMELGVLTAEETAELARAHGATDGEQIDTIVTLAEGNALATVEMASAGAQGRETPAGVRAAVQAQWRALSGEGRRMLGAAAVIGPETSHGLLSQVSQASEAPTPDQPGGSVPELLASGLLQATETGYRFRHALERRAVYELLLPEERIGLHERVARQLAARRQSTVSRNPQLAAEIAAHWCLTDHLREATESCLDAGMAAYEVGAYPEALDHLERGLRSWMTAGASAGWLRQPMHNIAFAFCDATQSMEERARGARLLDALVPHSTGDERADLLAWLAVLSWHLGDRAAGENNFERAASSAVSARRRSEVLVRYAGYLANAGAQSKSRALLTDAIAGFDGVDAPWHAWGLGHLASLMALNGERDKALRTVDEGRRMALRLDDEFQIWSSLSSELIVYHLVDQPVACQDAAMEIIDRARRTRLVRSQAALSSLSNAAEALVMTGRWDDALTVVDEVCADQPPASEAEAGLQNQKALVLLRRGQGADARRCLSWAREATGAEWIATWSELYRFAAEERTWAGDADAALAAVSDGVRALCVPGSELPVDALPFATVGLRVTADAVSASGSPERARGLAAELDAVVAKFLHRAEAQGSLWIAAHTSLAAAESARGRGVDEPAQWRRAVEAWQARLNPYDVAYCQFREAESRVRHGDRRGAQAPLRDALATASQLRAAPLSDALTALARRARIPVSAESEQQAAAVPPRAAAAGLTQRECEVLRLLLDGLTNRQIARSLTISERTVGVHVSNVLGKLGVHSRAQAAALTHSSRLLADD